MWLGQRLGEAKGSDLVAPLFLAELQVWDQEAKRGPETLDLGVLPTLEWMETSLTFPQVPPEFDLMG